MKNCNEMVNSLLERRAQYVTEQKRKRKIIVRTTSSLCCVCIVALVGFGVWQGDFFGVAPIPPNNSIIIGEKDYIDPVDNTDRQVNENVQNETSGQDSVEDWKGVIIDEYDAGIATSYEIPDNKHFGISIPLRSAIKEYGDTVRYMVVIDIFKDKEQVSSDKSILEAELTRLTELGYDAIIEVNDIGTEPVYYFCLQASKEQLENFVCNEEYGYFLFGRSERVE